MIQNGSRWRKKETEDGTVQIRPMCPADIPAVAELDRQISQNPGVNRDLRRRFWDSRIFSGCRAGGRCDCRVYRIIRLL